MKTRVNVLIQRTKRMNWITLSVLICCLAVTGQTKLEPAPENFNAVNEPGSPVQISINGIYPSSPKFRTIDYSIQNTAISEIRSIIIRATFGSETRNIFLGLQGNMSYQLGFEGGIRAGRSKSFVYLLSGMDGESLTEQLTDGLVLKTDFVLFRDGTNWGPDLGGESEFLIGVFEGHEGLLFHVKNYVAVKDYDGLTTVINRDGPPLEMVAIQNRTNRQIGYGRGYSVARLTFQADLLGRGDLTGVPARIRDMERELGLVPPIDDKRKQISHHFNFNEPISITGFSLRGRNIALDERFTASGNWLTGLELSLKNNSGRVMKILSLGISFPETQNTGQQMSLNLHYGPHPVTMAENNRQPRVAPDQSFQIIVDGERPGSLKKFLESRQKFDTISRAVIDIKYIDFEDGTRWVRGQLARRDPENQDRWVVIK